MRVDRERMMRRQNKILLGVLAFFPLGYIVFFVAAVLLFALTMVGTLAVASTTPSGEPDVNPFVILGPFLALFGLHLLAMLITVAQLIVYLILVLRNQLLADNERIFWALAILFAGAFASPAYWYLKVWPLPDTVPS